MSGSSREVLALKEAAEARSQQLQEQKEKAEAKRKKQQEQQKLISQSIEEKLNKNQLSPETAEFLSPCHVNETDKKAKIAEADFLLNGARARAGTEDWVGPRWVPDEEVNMCSGCHKEFDWLLRRHHCRHCGLIFCGACSSSRALLPPEFKVRDPQRVCFHCAQVLGPHQSVLADQFANHQKENIIDLSQEALIRRYTNMPFSMTLGSEIRKAAYAVHNILSPGGVIKDSEIPLKLIKQARGLAFVTAIKGGFMLAGRVGTGLVIARKDGTDQWSAPSAIGVVGVSWGALIGANITDYIIILNTQEAVDAFSGTGQISLGAGIDVAIGPLGRSGSAGASFGDGGLASAYSYSYSRGLLVGISLDGLVILSRPDVNNNFYGRELSPVDILRGPVPRPRAAQPLYDALDLVTREEQLALIRGRAGVVDYPATVPSVFTNNAFTTPPQKSLGRNEGTGNDASSQLAIPSPSQI